MCYLYENTSKTKTLDETIEFKLTGLQIIGQNTSKVKVRVGPGESKFIELKAINNNWSVQCANGYSIF